MWRKAIALGSVWILGICQNQWCTRASMEEMWTICRSELTPGSRRQGEDSSKKGVYWEWAAMKLETELWPPDHNSALNLCIGKPSKGSLRRAQVTYKKDSNLLPGIGSQNLLSRKMCCKGQQSSSGYFQFT